MGIALGSGAFAWVARGPAAEPGVRRLAVTGVVVAAPHGRDVTIAHDDIPDYMPAMTMSFTLAEGESTRLAPGDRVRFLLCVGSGPTVAEDVDVTGRNAAIPVDEAAPPPKRLRRGDTIAPFALIDERGRAFTDADLRGHQTILTFIFTRCPVPEYCPLVTARFKALQTHLTQDRSLPRDARLLSVTLDPAFDRPGILAAYGAAVGASPDRWRFATGEPDAVMRVARAFSVYVERNGALLDHTLATALVDRDGRILEIWRGNAWKLEEVTTALRASAADRTN